jgi:hypothetical protein
MQRSRRSSLFGSAMSASVTAHGSGGTHSCTAGEKGAVLMSFSISSTSCWQCSMKKQEADSRIIGSKHHIKVVC